MKKPWFGSIALTLLVALSTTVSAETASLKDARTFVAQAQIGRNLHDIALSVAKRTATYALITSTLGSAGAASAVSDEINALLPQYQPKWDENIAQAYEKSFSEEELSSLAAEGRASKYAGKVVERQPEIGNTMQSSAKPILTALVSEALNVTMSKHTTE
ncbi:MULTISPECIES: hypothetical protein [unclassified Pseudomonas]|uniref:hypothetical protein n=1 Tax=unclassified Pseudomonas TaxID=196821 RepID=UPI002AC91B93|nr:MULTISPECIES: hypothetical protein [unclassified Pseudomonas]MEB0045619.1 hypothetical protein [Pseudomonas sp. Dout3]MEB0095502.1 hypothetical protein [Pseudomonas sp. DC1.2]WPX61084.1 hypothetical protein RHM68_10755 [Pseudomonas sp. DC1.2]